MGPPGSVMEEGPGTERVPPSTRVSQQDPAEGNAAQTVGQADPSHRA